MLLITNRSGKCECDADAIIQWANGILKPSSVWCEEHGDRVFASVYLQGIHFSRSTSASSFQWKELLHIYIYIYIPIEDILWHDFYCHRLVFRCNSRSSSSW